MKDTIHPLLAAASFVIVVAGLRAAAPIVSLFLLAVLLTTSVAPVVLGSCAGAGARSGRSC
jgi:hypothetical protein